LLKTEHSQTKIAAVIGVNKSTISRELGRNRGQRGYRPNQAHQFAQQRRRKAVQKRISTETWTLIYEKIRQDWSPEQISGWMKKNTGTDVSHEWYFLTYHLVALDT
jgi:IS30 family transposase